MNAEKTVSFIAGAIASANSQLAFVTTSFSAAKGTSAVTLTLKDSNKNPIKGKSSDEITKSFTFTKMLGSAATNLTNDDAVGILSGWSESSDGVYTSTYTPGKYSGTTTAKVVVGGYTSNSVGLTTSPDIKSAQVLSQTSSLQNTSYSVSGNAIAGSGYGYVIKMNIADANGNKFIYPGDGDYGLSLNIVGASGISFTPSSPLDIDNTSIVSAVVTSTTPGSVSVTTNVVQSTAAAKSTSYTFVADANNPVITWSGGNVGQVDTNVTSVATLTDKYGNNLENVNIGFTAAPSTSSKIISINGAAINAAQGSFGFTTGNTVTVVTQGNDVANGYSVTPTFKGNDIDNALTVSLDVNPTALRFDTLSATGTAMANNSDVNKISVSVTDKYGNPIDDEAIIKFSIASGDTSESGLSQSSTAGTNSELSIQISKGNAVAYLNSYILSQVITVSILNPDTNDVIASRNITIKFKRWVETAQDTFKADNSSKNYNVSTKWPTRITNGSNYVAPTAAGENASDYDYYFVDNNNNQINISWATLDGSTGLVKITAKPSLPATLKTFAKYKGSAHKPDRTYAPAIQQYWTFAGTSFYQNYSSCSVDRPGYNYPYSKDVQNFVAQQGKVAQAVNGGFIKYTYGSTGNRDPFGRVDYSDGHKIGPNSSKNGAIWCYTNN